MYMVYESYCEFYCSLIFYLPKSGRCTVLVRRISVAAEVLYLILIWVGLSCPHINIHSISFVINKTVCVKKIISVVASHFILSNLHLTFNFLEAFLIISKHKVIKRIGLDPSSLQVCLIHQILNRPFLSQ
jgi:hypothetical protein